MAVNRMSDREKRIAEIRDNIWMNRLPGGTVVISEEKLLFLLSELTEKEEKLNQAVEALKTIMYLPSSHSYVRAIADNALQSIKGGESQ